MAKCDMASNIYVWPTIIPQVVTAAVSGEEIDVQGYESVTLLLTIGTYGDGNYAILLEDSDDDVNYSPVLESTGLLINVANFPYSDSPTDYTIVDDTFEETSFWVGYAGSKRYVRAHLYEDSASSGTPFSAEIILGHPHSAPTE